jgi:hypothetical protein
MPIAPVLSLASAVGTFVGGTAERLAEGLGFDKLLMAAGETDTQAADETAIAASRVATLKATADAVLDRFRRILSDRLAEAGLALPDELTLASDGFGDVQISGDHSDRAAIAHLIAGDGELSDLFRQLEALHEELARLEGTPHEPDRVLGITSFGASTDSTGKPTLRITLRGETAEATFI